MDKKLLNYISLLEKYTNKTVILQENAGNLGQLPGIKPWLPLLLQGTENTSKRRQGSTSYSNFSPSSKVEKLEDIQNFDKDKISKLVRKGAPGIYLFYCDKIDDGKQPVIAINNTSSDFISSHFLYISYNRPEDDQGNTIWDTEERVKKLSIRNRRPGRGTDSYFQTPKRSKNLLDVFYQISYLIKNSKHNLSEEELVFSVYLIHEHEGTDIKDLRKLRSERNRKNNNPDEGTSLKKIQNKNKNRALIKLHKFADVLPEDLKNELVTSLEEDHSVNFTVKSNIIKYFDKQKQVFEKMFDIMHYGGYYHTDPKITNKQAVKELLNAKKFLDSIK